MDLVLERGWDAITVSEVCESANIGRSTFYVHFADKESLLLSGFDDLHVALAALRLSEQQAFAFAEPLFTHAFENADLLRAVASIEIGQQIQWRFRDVLVGLVTEELVAMGIEDTARSLVAGFIAGGFLELVMRALETPGSGEPHALAARFRELALVVVGGVRSPNA